MINNIPRFFINKVLSLGSKICLTKNIAKHIRVLRINIGDIIFLFNGNGGQYEAKILIIENNYNIKAYIQNFFNIEVETPYYLALAQCLAKNNKMNWLLEKSVELGIKSFIPIISDRSIVRLSNKKDIFNKILHWKKIFESSCEQCGRNIIPNINNIYYLKNWLNSLQEISKANELRLFLSYNAKKSLLDLPDKTFLYKKILVLIGPEGGFHTYEEDIIKSYGFISINLGKRILRVETAAIAILSVIASKFGGWK